MLLVRLREPRGAELVVANVHLSTVDPTDEALAAAQYAVAWSEGAPATERSAAKVGLKGARPARAKAGADIFVVPLG